ncbi:MAG: hypothetical protein AAFR51_15745 [Pseudomonadota bacterium]
MRLVLFILGGLLLLQTAVHIILTLMEAPVSFSAIGSQLDEDLVRLTAGACAVYVAGAVKPQKT